MSTKSIGDIADALFAINEKLTKANKAVTDLETEKRGIEDEMIAALEAQGIDSVKGKYATISITRSVKPQIADFEKLAAFVFRNKRLDLFERRISSKVYKELADERKGKGVPGLTEFNAVKLSVRKVTKE